MTLKKFFRWFLITLSVLIIAGSIFVIFFLKAFLIKKLTNELKHTFGNYYTIKYNSIETSLSLSGLSIVIDQPTFSSDTSNHNLNLKFPALFFKGDKLIIQNLSIRKLLFTHDLKLERITLKKPALKFIVFDSNIASVKRKKQLRKRKNYADLLSIQKIKIVNGSLVSCHYNDRSDTTFLGFNINANIDNINLPVTKLKTLAYSLTHKNNFQFSVARAYYKPYRSNYLFSMDSLALNDKTKIISAKNLSEIALKSKLEISRLFHFSKLIAEAKIGSFVLRGYDLKQLFLHNSINIRSIHIDKTNLDMFKNKRKQLDKQNEKLILQEILTSFPFSLIIDSIYVTRSDLRFELIDKKNKSPVAIYLNQFNALLVHINTIKGSTDTMVLTSNGKFMNSAYFKIKAVFPDIYKVDNSYSGYVGPMSFKKFNSILASYSGIKIVDGNINSIVFSGRCNKYENYGSLVFTYTDLEIEIDKIPDKQKNMLTKKRRKKARLLSLLGNVLLHNNNPRKQSDDPVRVNYYFKREKYQNHVVLWVGGLLEGVKNTLLNKNVQEKGKQFLKKKK